jgi:peptide/nickel transport system permease protein
MLRYVGQRAFDALATIMLVLTLVFVAMRILPGDPALVALGDNATVEQLAQFRERMGLNDPLAVQYVKFVWHMLQFDFGRSFLTNEPIGGMLAIALPYTFQLTISAIIIGLLIGVPAGVISATRRGQPADYAARMLALIGFCVPEFYLGALMLIVFALKLDLFPIMGGGEGLLDRLAHLVLPAFTLGLVMAAFACRLTRASLLEVLRRDFIRTARAKGVPNRIVIYKHALRNALIPVVTGFGLYILSMLSGSISVELVFSRPGIGTVLVNGIMSRDYPVVQAGLVVFAFFVVVVNMSMDLLYGAIDPRVRAG